MTSHVLEPGAYLIETRFARPVRKEQLQIGLERLGFEDVRLDSSVSRMMHEGEPIHFVGRISDGFVLEDTPAIDWHVVNRLAIDPYQNLRYKLMSFSLLNGFTYDVRFISYVKAQTGKTDVEEALANMGWRVIQTCQLNRNIRVPGRPAIDTTLWCGRMKWISADSFITEVDPFHFEDCEKLEIESNGDVDVGGRDSGVCGTEVEAESGADASVLST